MGGLTDSIWADPNFQSNNVAGKKTAKRAVVKCAAVKPNILDVATREAFAKSVAAAAKQNAPEKEEVRDKDMSTTTTIQQHEPAPPAVPMDTINSMFTSLKISSGTPPVAKTVVAPMTTSTTKPSYDTIPEIFVVNSEDTTKPTPASESDSTPTAPPVKRPSVLVPIKKIVATDQPAQPKPAVANGAAPSTAGPSMGAAPQSKKEESSGATTMLFQGKSKQANEPNGASKAAFTFAASSNPTSIGVAPAKAVPNKAVPDSAVPAGIASNSVAAPKIAPADRASTDVAPIPVVKVAREGFNEDGLPLLFRGKGGMDPELMAFNESLTKGGDGRKKFAPRQQSSFVDRVEDRPITRSMAAASQSTKQAPTQTVKQVPLQPAKHIAAQPVKQAAGQAVDEVAPNVAANTTEKPLKMVSIKNFKPSAEYYQEKGEHKKLSALRGKELQLEQQLAATRKQKADLTKRLAKDAAKDASL